MSNADDHLTDGKHVLGGNLFTYDWNNPIMYTDESGMLPKWLKGALIGAATAMVGVIAATVISVPLAAAAATAAVIGMGGTVFEKTVLNEKDIDDYTIQDIGDVAVAGLSSAVSACVPGAGIGNMVASSMVSAAIEEAGDYVVNGDAISIADFAESTAIGTVSEFIDAGVENLIDTRVKPYLYPTADLKPAQVKNQFGTSRTSAKRTIRYSARMRVVWSNNAKVVANVATSFVITSAKKRAEMFF